MAHINQRLPLRISEGTPSRIDTADGWSFGVEWRNTNHENPYGEAEEFAAFIVRAVNAHDDLVKALEAALATHGDQYSWGPIARDALAKAAS